MLELCGSAQAGSFEVRDQANAARADAGQVPVVCHGAWPSEPKFERSVQCGKYSGSAFWGGRVPTTGGGWYKRETCSNSSGIVVPQGLIYTRRACRFAESFDQYVEDCQEFGYASSGIGGGLRGDLWRMLRMEAVRRRRWGFRGQRRGGNRTPGAWRLPLLAVSAGLLALAGTGPAHAAEADLEGQWWVVFDTNGQADLEPTNGLKLRVSLDWPSGDVRLYEMITVGWPCEDGCALPGDVVAQWSLAGHGLRLIGNGSTGKNWRDDTFSTVLDDRDVFWTRFHAINCLIGGYTDSQLDDYAAAGMAWIWHRVESSYAPRTITVGASGSDDTASLADAALLGYRNETIVLGPGTYYGQGEVVAECRWNFTITGSGDAADTVIDGQDARRCVLSHRGIGLQNLTLRRGATWDDPADPNTCTMGCGGGLFVRFQFPWGGFTTLTDCIIRDCYSESGGGGAHVEGAQLLRVVFEGNMSGGSGSAISLFANSPGDVAWNCEFRHNTGGSAIYWIGGSMHLYDALVEENDKVASSWSGFAWFHDSYFCGNGILGNVNIEDNCTVETYCNALVGACCFGGYCIEGHTQSGCDSGGGVFLGIGSACDGADCGDVGACCMSAGYCRANVSPVECDADGGTFMGDGSTCGGNPCDFGVPDEPDGQDEEPEYPDVGPVGSADKVVIITHGIMTGVPILDLPNGWDTTGWGGQLASAIDEPLGSDWLVIPVYTGYTVNPWAPWYESRGRYVASVLANEEVEHVHLIAHSAGAWFIDACTERLRELRGNATTIHATYLDPCWRPGSGGSRGEDADFAESYFSYEGMAPHCGTQVVDAVFTQSHYDECVNIDVSFLDPTYDYDGWLPCKSTHAWPHCFYRLTALADVTSDDDCADMSGEASYQGYYLGLAIAREDYPTEEAWLADIAAAGLTRGMSIELPFTRSRPPGPGDRSSPLVVERLDDPLILSALTYATHGTVSVGDSSTTLDSSSTESPSWVNFSVTPQVPVNFIQLELTPGADSDAIGVTTVLIDGVEVGVVDERHVASDGFVTIYGVDWIVPPDKEFILSIRLDTMQSGSSSMNAKNIQTGLSARLDGCRFDVYSELDGGGSGQDGWVRRSDLLMFLNEQWGACVDNCAPSVCGGDFNLDCTVNIFDLLELLENWGECHD